jgi:hypothetical protein
VVDDTTFLPLCGGGVREGGRARLSAFSPKPDEF